MKKSMFEKMKGYIGLFLIIIAIGGIFFWEKYGRERLLFKEEIVFNEDTPPNTLITKEMLTTISLEKDKLINNSVTNLNEVVGKETKIFIPKNAPLHKSYFDNPNIVPDKEEYIAAIPMEWIKAFPGTLRRKDTIYVYEYTDDKKLNTAEIVKQDQQPMNSEANIKLPQNEKPIAKFAVAYVKDGTNKEVVDSGKIERLDATSKIEKIEVVTTNEQIKLMENSYKKGNKFILMYK